MALDLWLYRTSQTLTSTKDNAIVDAWWDMFYASPLLLIYFILGSGETYIHVSAWASGVARSVEVGNAKALYSRMSDNVQTLTLFLYLWT